MKNQQPSPATNAGTTGVVIDQRRSERRNKQERRGGLRWDPRQTDRRGGADRRVPVTPDNG